MLFREVYWHTLFPEDFPEKKTPARWNWVPGKKQADRGLVTGIRKLRANTGYNLIDARFANIEWRALAANE